VSVVTPARNAGPWVADAVASTLLQDEVTLEQIVVDDASTDDTVAVVERLDDPRVRLLRNRTHRGIGHSHNRALEAARGRFLVHLDADDVLLRGALRAVTGALRERPDAAYAWAWHVEADAACRVDEAEFRRQRDFRAAQDRFHPDVRRALLVHGMVANPLRTYRRDVFDVVGWFDEDLPWAVDFDMAVRVANRFDGVRVPRVLYVQRVHGGNVQQALGFRALRSWAMRARICRRRLRTEGGALLGRSALGVYALQAAGLAHALRLPRLARRVVPFRQRGGAAERTAGRG
jgi:glycosyltransferase involved in cell wall biosynthesis